MQRGYRRPPGPGGPGSPAGGGRFGSPAWGRRGGRGGSYGPDEGSYGPDEGSYGPDEGSYGHTPSPMRTPGRGGPSGRHPSPSPYRTHSPSPYRTHSPSPYGTHSPVPYRTHSPAPYRRGFQGSPQTSTPQTRTGGGVEKYYSPSMVQDPWATLKPVEVSSSQTRTPSHSTRYF
ncbi:hypothetical protein N1851_013593 [Merluccius polli]|uniref:Uncharacterized protein n=1 Tax=Merluccius polli TaxID=89951 RepID=A0AA47P3K4_MERPO|nr:hypothetical protein N1851_013593 [Merluccius polli]